MLLGEQDNVAFIDFVPGENAETLIVKYNEKSVGWIPAAACCSGGYRAAARSTPPAALRSTKKTMRSGVNIPMLVETFMAGRQPRLR